MKTETGGEPLFLTGDRITDELARRGIQLRGKRLDSIDLRKIERTLLSMPIYKRAEAFIAPLILLRADPPDGEAPPLHRAGSLG